MPSVFSQGGQGSAPASNASVGPNNATAPTSSTEIGSIDSGGKLQGASASNPIPVTLEADVVAVDAQITGHIGGILDALIGGTAPANALLVGGSDGTDLRALTVIDTVPAGTEYGVITKALQRKNTQILSTTPLGAGGTFTSSWFDTNQTGSVIVEATAYSGGSNTTLFSIQQCDDTSNGLTLTTVAVAAAGYPTSNSLYQLYGVVTGRYWRVTYTASSAQSSFEITATDSAIGASVIAGLPNSNGYQQFPLTTYSNGVYDNSVYPSDWVNIGGQAAMMPVALFYGTGPHSASPPVTVAARTPNLFQGAIITGGVTTVWQPVTGKKCRLMRYKIEVGEDCSYSGAVTPVMLAWAWGLSTTSAGVIGNSYPYQPTMLHRVVIPSTVLATSGVLWDSDWIDLGNGYINPTATLPLQMGMNVAQSTGATTPTFGLSASEQWEAGTMGFKTVGGLGGAVLRQQWNVSTSGVLGASSMLAGNTLIVVARVTNSAVGTSVLSISDANTNSWTSLGAITNTSDSTHGSSLYMFYSIGIKGSASDVITVAGSNSPTLIEVMALEYHGVTAIGTTGLSSATGSSSAPSSGSYTPGEVGDLIITACASQCAGIALTSQPTIATYTMRGTIFAATGALCVADNFGNGSLATGGINVQVIGTEE